MSTLAADPGMHDVLAQPGEDFVLSAAEEVRDLSEVRRRDQDGLTRADVATAIGLGWTYAVLTVLTVVMAAIGRVSSPTQSTIIGSALLIALYALAHRTEFEAATGSAVPTEPVFVAMLFVIPLPVVPLALLLGLVLGSTREQGPGGWAYRTGVTAMSGWHCIGPVIVLAVADPGPASLAHWPVYLAALLSQFVIDGVVAAIRCRALNMPLTGLVSPMGWTFGVDAMLAPVGLCAVIASDGSPAVVLLVAAPLGLVRLLAHDRTANLERAVTLGNAFAESQTEARVDSMTGIANRRAWDEGISQLQTSASSVAVLIADLDHLKHTNDTLGHDAGDRMICAAATLLAELAPTRSIVARIGGDEFGVLIRDASPTAGCDLVNAVRSGMAPLGVSMSMGTTTCGADELIKGIAAADAAAAADKAARRVQRAG